MKEILFVHKCCGNGNWFLKDYVSKNNLKHGEFHVTKVNQINARDQKLNEKYKEITIPSLDEFCYIVDMTDGKVIKSPSKQPKLVEAKEAKDLKIVPITTTVPVITVPIKK